MIFRIKDKLEFPDPRFAEDEGLLAYGGDLSVERLKLAYSMGIFPWYSFREGCLMWWCPKRRFVLFPGEVHVSHSMRSLINSGKYRVTFNTSFPSVIRACALVNNRIDDENAWLGPDIIEAYTKLHDQGLAESVEVWNAEGKLVGGFYGVVRGKCFFGESMFSLEPNTSKLALVSLCRKMQAEGGLLIDCQVESPHLKTMGARIISYSEYMECVNQ